MDLIEQLLSDTEIVDAYNEIDSKNNTANIAIIEAINITKYSGSCPVLLFSNILFFILLFNNT